MEEVLSFGAPRVRRVGTDLPLQALTEQEVRQATATMRNLRDKVWFPSMDKRVQEYVQT